MRTDPHTVIYPHSTRVSAGMPPDIPRTRGRVVRIEQLLDAQPVGIVLLYFGSHSRSPGLVSTIRMDRIKNDDIIDRTTPDSERGFFSHCLLTRSTPNDMKVREATLEK